MKHGVRFPVKSSYLHTWRDHRRYGYIINSAFASTLKILKWNGLVFHWCLYNKQYYRPAYRYEFYLLVFNLISHSFAALTHETSSWPLKDKIHIHAWASNTLYLIHWYLADFNTECRTHYQMLILKLRVILHRVKSGSFNGMASPTNIQEFFMFKVKFIRENSENFFNCKLPVLFVGQAW